MHHLWLGYDGLCTCLVIISFALQVLPLKVYPKLSPFTMDIYHTYLLNSKKRLPFLPEYLSMRDGTSSNDAARRTGSSRCSTWAGCDDWYVEERGIQVMGKIAAIAETGKVAREPSLSSSGASLRSYSSLSPYLPLLPVPSLFR